MQPKHRRPVPGEKVGELTVLRPERDHGYAWSCRCSCGDIVYRWPVQLFATSHPACVKCRYKRPNISTRYIRPEVGEIIGDLTVVGFNTSRHQWECRCVCGATSFRHLYALYQCEHPTCNKCRQQKRNRRKVSRWYEINVWD